MTERGGYELRPTWATCLPCSPPHKKPAPPGTPSPPHHHHHLLLFPKPVRSLPFIRLLRHFFPVAVSDRVRLRRPTSKSALGSSGAVASPPLLRFASSGVLGATFGFVDGVLGPLRPDMSPFQGYRGKGPCFWLRRKICSSSCEDWISFCFVLTEPLPLFLD
jgi:hypothetical protein